MGLGYGHLANREALRWRVTFQVLDRMQRRLRVARTDCDDTTLFLELMYLGELTLKSMVAGMVAAVDDDRDRHRYRLEYGLVRASGVGDWSMTLDDLLTGPAASTLAATARVEGAELTRNFDLRTDCGWQVDAVEGILAACRVLDPSYYIENTRISARVWARHFVWLRNKTRGHGATTAGDCRRMAPFLDESIEALVNGFSLFSRDWAYLHQNLSGKYRVVSIGDDAPSLDYLKRPNDAVLNDGVYIVFDTPRPVRLLTSDVDLSDFFLCNGGYSDNDGTCEALSYVTDQRRQVAASDWRLLPTALPDSETEGRGILEPQGGLFGNIPARQQDYVGRPHLEEELTRALINDRHAIITLVGRGGIGKTSLAVELLHQLSASVLPDRFFAMLWFSARDVDLTQLGPKLVRPRVVSIADVAEQFTDLMRPEGSSAKGFRKVEHFAEQLTASGVGPLLFIFDNFETVVEPQQMYEWLDNYVRPPNKILITTRLRDFKGDYPVEVGGMRRSEFDTLVDQSATRLEITSMITPALREDLYEKADGHPYIAKLLLGDLATHGKRLNLSQLVASREDVLQALFERTFNQISPLARRLFLTLCGWRSSVPRLAVEAALLRVAEEPLDTGRAVDQLIRSSLVESLRSPDGDDFVSVPLAAALFGRKKLQVSALRSAIEADLEFLQMFGAARDADVRKGLGPRLTRLFRALAVNAQSDSSVLTVNKPVLEHIARQYSPAWLLIADLYEEQQSPDWLAEAAEAVRHFLEEHPGSVRAWTRLASLARRQGDYTGEAQALVSRSTQATTTFEFNSEAVDRINALHSDGSLQSMPKDEKSILLRSLLEAVGAMDTSEITATDYSRLAWLAINAKDEGRAAKYVELGRAKDPSNIHIQRLAWVESDR